MNVKNIFNKNILMGDGVATKTTKLIDTKAIYKNPNLITNDQTIAYRVDSHILADASLCLGISHLEAGDVGGEFFMTRGHFHADLSEDEYYWGISGKGLLLLMDENRNTFFEEVFPGSLHYIKGTLAHRLVNIGDSVLSVGATWSPKAGYNYETIAKDGFSKRVFKTVGGYEVK